MKKPNILFLMSDEHRYDVSGFMGNSVIKTPVWITWQKMQLFLIMRIRRIRSVFRRVSVWLPVSMQSGVVWNVLQMI